MPKHPNTKTKRPSINVGRTNTSESAQAFRDENKQAHYPLQLLRKAGATKIHLLRRSDAGGMQKIIWKLTPPVIKRYHSLPTTHLSTLINPPLESSGVFSDVDHVALRSFLPTGDHAPLAEGIYATLPQPLVLTIATKKNEQQRHYELFFRLLTYRLC